MDIKQWLELHCLLFLWEFYAWIYTDNSNIEKVIIDYDSVSIVGEKWIQVRENHTGAVIIPTWSECVIVQSTIFCQIFYRYKTVTRACVLHCLLFFWWKFYVWIYADNSNIEKVIIDYDSASIVGEKWIQVRENHTGAVIIPTWSECIIVQSTIFC